MLRLGLKLRGQGTASFRIVMYFCSLIFLILTTTPPPPHLQNLSPVHVFHCYHTYVTVLNDSLCRGTSATTYLMDGRSLDLKELSKLTCFSVHR